MKKVWKALLLSMIVAVPVLASESNSLKDAYGYVALTAEHIKGLDSWNETSEICIGVDTSNHLNHDLAASQNFGLILEGPSLFSQHAALNHLTAISFDDADEIAQKKELIAERDGLNRGKGRILEVNALPKIKPSITAMGVPKKQ